MQKARLPLDILRISQGRWGQYSHANQNAVDFLGPENNRYAKVYAPYDCKITLIDHSWGAVFLESTDNVAAPNGTSGRQWMALLHDDDTSDLSLGMVISQGTHFYTMGKKDPWGNTTGVHVHIECGFGSGHSTWTSMQTAAHADIETCLFLSDDTTIVTPVYTWKTASGKLINGGTVPPDDAARQALLARIAALTGTRDGLRTALAAAQAEQDKQRKLKEEKEATERAEYARLRATEKQVDALVAQTRAGLAAIETEMTERFGL